MARSGRLAMSSTQRSRQLRIPCGMRLPAGGRTVLKSRRRLCSTIITNRFGRLLWGLEGTGKSTAIAAAAAGLIRKEGSRASEILVLCRDAAACCRMEELLLRRGGLTLPEMSAVGVRSFGEFVQDELDPGRLLPRAMSRREEVAFLSRHLDELELSLP